MHARMGFALLARTNQIPFFRLFSSPSSPNLFSELLHKRYRTCDLFLLNFQILNQSLMTAQCSSPTRSLSRHLVPQESTVPPSIVSSADLVMLHSTPASRSRIKILNRASLRLEHLRTSLVNAHLPNVASLTTPFEPCPLPALHPLHHY